MQHFIWLLKANKKVVNVMEFVIENSKLKAVISSNGAELRELYDSNNVNRMHSPSSKTWNRVSPILFPQVSRIKGGVYYVSLFLP